MPLAIDKEIRTPVKLPGPRFTIIEKLLSILTFFLLIKSNILFTSKPLFLILELIFLTKNLLLILIPIESFLPVKLIIKKSFITTLFIIIFFHTSNSYSQKIIIEDYGLISIMYHRFEENKYPSTNIKLNDFISHLNLIKQLNYKFIGHEEFNQTINQDNKQRKVLLTIDDGFLSFYKNAWPILKKEKIPFIIFINTETIGANGYMNWNQIREISKFNFVHIGNHSHSHGYLVDKSDKEILEDIKISKRIFKDKLNHETKFFAYPYGEYKNSYKKIIEDLGFLYAFGQHSGVIDKTKDKFELPRFPINEKYGKQERFNNILKSIAFPYKTILPEEKYLDDNSNPPDVRIIFEENMNYKNITCYSNEQNKWRKSELNFDKKNELKIILGGKFTTERGRINCSLREETGDWRWLGIQFVIKNL